MRGTKPKTRKRIVDAADGLFYGRGLVSVSMDAVAEAAGVTKRTVYDHFDSKDDLIAEVMGIRHEPTLARYDAWLERRENAAIGDQLESMFSELGQWAGRPAWKGCGFARAAVELIDLPGHPARALAKRHKAAFENGLRRRLGNANITDANAKARRVMLLLEGAVTLMLIHGDAAYAEEAGRAARAVVEA